MDVFQKSNKRGGFNTRGDVTSKKYGLFTKLYVKFNQGKSKMNY